MPAPSRSPPPRLRVKHQSRQSPGAMRPPRPDGPIPILAPPAAALARDDNLVAARQVGRSHEMRSHPTLRPMPRSALVLATLVFAAAPLPAAAQGTESPRPRARDLGVAPGIFRPGTHNAITDVSGVRVGQTTIVEGDSVRTGVTAILPHGGDLFRDRVPAALFVGNGFGKLLGVTQLRELDR